jgi:hypothetical protein
MLDPRSFLFITLDSCRYDTFAAASAPNLKSIGKLYRADAPGNFTYASHAAMFVGFTPGAAERAEPYANPKYGKIFKMRGGGFTGKTRPFVVLSGRNIVDGLKQKGFSTIGTGAVSWFNHNTPTGRSLTSDFEAFFYPGSTHALTRQLAWIEDRLAEVGNRPVFVFLNVGETHVPYYHEGASWSSNWNPCVPFAKGNDASECRRRQLQCLEWVDERLTTLLDRFRGANVLVCADHGDAWGEDGLWEHGFHHQAVIDVPLLFRLQRSPDQSGEWIEYARQRVLDLGRDLLGALSVRQPA